MLFLPLILSFKHTTNCQKHKHNTLGPHAKQTPLILANLLCDVQNCYRYRAACEVIAVLTVY